MDSTNFSNRYSSFHVSPEEKTARQTLIDSINSKKRANNLSHRNETDHKVSNIINKKTIG
jgi:hypothetical protein